MPDTRPAGSIPFEIPADPYPIYAQLLRDGRPFLHDHLGAWVVCRHADVRNILGDRRFSIEPSARAGRPSARPVGSPSIAEIRRVMNARGRGMSSQDPPEHTRLRGLVSRAFTARRVHALRPRIEAIARQLLDDAPADDFDLIRDFAGPLPALVISELMGIPASDHRAIKRWSTALAPIVGDGFMPEEDGPAALVAAHAMIDYMTRIIAEKRRAPGDDLIGGMLLAQTEHEAATDDEILVQSLSLLFAGHETTTNLIGNGTVLLLEHPEALARVREEPGCWRTAIEELLRFDPPVQALSRGALEDTPIGDVVIPKGERAILVLAAANRDPAVFERPEQLDVTRSPNPHISFGHGIHMCLGAALARLEAQIAFPMLLERFPELALAAPPVRGVGFTFRGYARVPLRTALPVRSAPAPGT